MRTVKYTIYAAIALVCTVEILLNIGRGNAGWIAFYAACLIGNAAGALATNNPE